MYLFVSGDKLGNPPDNVVEAHIKHDDERNNFILIK